MVRRLIPLLLTASLGGIGMFVYNSPLPGGPAAPDRTDAPDEVTLPLEEPPAGSGGARGAGSGHRSGLSAQPAAATTPVRRTGPVAARATASRGGSGAPARVVACDDFQWQQDAQAVYVRDLTDPLGLDGRVGPADDDGIACRHLPVDPDRPQSEPAGAKPAVPPPPPQPEPLPVAPPIESILQPQSVYYGVSTPQAPFDWKEVRIFEDAVRKSPNLLLFFQGWDRQFPTDAVVSTWRQGMLPMVSWEPRPTVQPQGPDTDNAEAPDYQLSTIISGGYDSYIDQWATAARDLGLPVVVRFAHEMNGWWYPWSEQANGNRPGEYVQMWRHVRDRFTAIGATNVIWLWSPNVITSVANVPLSDLYPGDDYVDWAGLVGYYRKPIPDKPATFNNTFASSLAELRQVTSKPIVMSEVGCTEVGGNKAGWITSFFSTLPSHPDIVGFVWFDHSVNGSDWRVESSRGAVDAFASGVADPRYGSRIPTTAP